MRVSWRYNAHKVKGVRKLNILLYNVGFNFHSRPNIGKCARSQTNFKTAIENLWCHVLYNGLNFAFSMISLRVFKEK